jgi:tetratricopeptide (TPR) repeat protein
MDARRTPERPVPGVPRHTPDPTLERGFVASLRWLVAEGEARGVRRIAVELRALREALATLDETRRARDEHSDRATTLEREIQDALRLLGDATKVEGNGSLAARLARLREIVRRDLTARRALVQERDSWRAMCEYQVRSRAAVHMMLEESEREREILEADLGTLRDRMTVLSAVHQETVDEVSDQRRAASMAVTELARLQETAATLRERVMTLERERAQVALLRERLQDAEAERERAQEDARQAREAARRHADDYEGLRARLRAWSGAVERALADLTRAVEADGPPPQRGDGP